MQCVFYYNVDKDLMGNPGGSAAGCAPPAQSGEEARHSGASGEYFDSPLGLRMPAVALYRKEIGARFFNESADA